MRLGVRARSTLLAASTVALALVLGGIAMVWVLQRNLEDNIDRALETQVADRAALLDDGVAPQSLVDTKLSEAFVWIGTTDGVEVAAGGAVRVVDIPPMDAESARSVSIVIEEIDESNERERYELRIASAPSARESLVVVAGAPIEGVGDAIGAVRQILVVAVPSIVLLVAGIAWLTTGRALRPVREIRAEAEAISGAHLDTRVPVPPGRDEIHQLAQTMNGMLDRIDSHQRSMRRFTSDASHELKSPVANIRAMVETSSLDGSEWDRLERRIVHETDRLRDLVNNLLFLASHDDDAAPPRATVSVDVDDLLFREAEVVASTTDRKVDISGVEPVQVVGDRLELERLVRNLADNAARHATSTVSFASTEHDGWVAIRVSDDGFGVPPDQREAIFERFTRLDEHRARSSGGTGLGLAIARQIAEGHHGSIEVEEGSPSTFVVRLPNTPTLTT